MEILNSPDLRDGHCGRDLGSMPTVVVHWDSFERSRLIDTNQNSIIPKKPVELTSYVWEFRNDTVECRHWWYLGALTRAHWETNG